MSLVLHVTRGDKDLSPNEHILTPTGGIVRGKCLECDGVDDRILFSAGTEEEGTVSMWISPDDAADSGTTLSQRIWYGTNANRSEIMYAAANGVLRFSIDNGGWTNLDTNKDTWIANAWYFLVFIWDGEDNYIYVDGDLDNSVSDDAGSVSLNGVTIGGRVGQNHFDGKIDDIRIYSVAKSAAWIKRYYEMTKGQY